MYAIPAETASQNMPFEKENLPGPGKLTSESEYLDVLLLFNTLMRKMLQRLYKHRLAQEMASSCLFAKTMVVSLHTCGRAQEGSGIWLVAK